MRRPAQDRHTLHPNLASGVHIAVITSQYNGELTASLERACLDTLAAHGVPANHIHAMHVPGALEIPVVASRIARSGNADAIIALGVVLKGETYHFELVANEAARGCQQVALETGVPVIMEVLACYTEAQAQARCGNNGRNKGIEAAAAAIAMLNLMSSIGKKINLGN